MTASTALIRRQISSIFAREKQGCGRPVSLGNDPHPLTPDFVDRQHTESIQHRQIVFLGVFRGHIAPQATVMLANVRRGIDAVMDEVLMNARSGNDLPQRKQRPIAISDRW